MAKNSLSAWALTLLRVVLGIIFAYHGYLKLFVPGGFQGTVTMMGSLGMPVPLYTALLVSVVEFAGGILLFLGLITKWTSAALIIEMLVALFAVHLKNGLLVSKGGYEFVLLILAALIVVLINRTGTFSLGKKISKSKNWQ